MAAPESKGVGLEVPLTVTPFIFPDAPEADGIAIEVPLTVTPFVFPDAPVSFGITIEVPLTAPAGVTGPASGWDEVGDPAEDPTNFGFRVPQGRF